MTRSGSEAHAGHARRSIAIGLSIVLLLVAALTSIAPVAAQDLEGRDAALVIPKNMSSDLTMDPARAYEELYQFVLGNTYNRLVKFPTSAEGVSFDDVVGDLAESWEVNEDATVYTFTLKPDAVFHSGNPVTAEDVRWTYQRFINVGGTPSFLVANIESIEAPDERTVIITMKSPDPGFIKALTAPNFAVLDSEVVKANGGTDAEDAATTDTADDFLSTQSAGSGPYRLTSHERAQRLVLERFDEHWAGDPGEFEQVIVQHIPEAEAQAAALQRGDVDMTWTVLPDISQSLESEGFQVVKAPTLQWYYLSLTADPANNEALANEKVHLALKYATDWDGLAQVCPTGSTRVYGIAPEAIGGAGPDDPGVIHEDLDKARELLAEAGYADGFDMTLTTFKFAGYCPLWEDLVLKLAQDWGRVGVNVEASAQDFDTWVTGMRAGEFDGVVIDWLAGYADPVEYALAQLPGSTIATRARWGEGDNAGTLFEPDPERFPSLPRIMELTEQLKSSTDPDERRAILEEIEPLFIQGGQNVGLLVLEQQYVAMPEVEGFNFHPIYRFDLQHMGRDQ